MMEDLVGKATDELKRLHTELKAAEIVREAARKAMSDANDKLDAACKAWWDNKDALLTTITGIPF